MLLSSFCIDLFHIERDLSLDWLTISIIVVIIRLSHDSESRYKPVFASQLQEKKKETRNVSTVHGCPSCGVPGYKTAKFYLVQMP